MSCDILSINQVSKSLRGLPVLKDISLSVRQGEWVALIGPNGCGKTTLFRCVTGLYRVPKGTISLSGYDIAMEADRAKQIIGYACETDALPTSLTGTQVRDLLLRACGTSAPSADCQEIWDLLGLDRFADIVISRYSSGMKQKLSLALAFLNRPSLLLLDETLNYLDPVSTYDSKQFISHGIKTGRFSALMSTHDLITANEICDRTILLIEGVVEGSWASQRSSGTDTPARSHERAIVDRLRQHIDARPNHVG